MSRWWLIGVLLLAGCQNVVGPFRARAPARVDDPVLTISEQERLGRDRLALPEEAFTVGPKSGAARPGTYAPH